MQASGEIFNQFEIRNQEIESIPVSRTSLTIEKDVNYKNNLY